MDVEDVMEKYWKDYSEDPKGWSFWTDKSEDFYNVYVIREGEGYFIKVDSIYNKNPMGIGTEIKVEKDQLEKDLPESGFRKFTKDELKGFLRSLAEVQDEKEKKELVEKQMRKKPTLPTEVDKEEYMMIGPLYTGSPFRYSLENQESKDKELRKKLKKRFRKKYPMYG